MKKISAIAGLLALALLVAAPVRAAEFLFPKQPQNGNVTVSASETHKNLYTAGGNIFIEGKTSGDLFAAGGVPANYRPGRARPDRCWREYKCQQCCRQ